MRKRCKNRRILIFVLSLLLGFVTYSQNRTVTGTVSSTDDSVGLPGVNVLEKGTTNGVVTDFHVKYSIEVSVNATLIFSYIGFVTEERSVNERSEINVFLADDATSLDEMVILDYGSQIKKEVTGSIQTINAADLADIPVFQVTQKSQGKLAGVQLKQTTGKPGQGVSVRIRGQLSVSGSSDPLYVVDCFPISSGAKPLNNAFTNISLFYALPASESSLNPNF